MGKEKKLIKTLEWKTFQGFVEEAFWVDDDGKEHLEGPSDGYWVESWEVERDAVLINPGGPSSPLLLLQVPVQ